MRDSSIFAQLTREVVRLNNDDCGDLLELRMCASRDMKYLSLLLFPTFAPLLPRLMFTLDNRDLRDEHMGEKVARVIPHAYRSFVFYLKFTDFSTSLCPYCKKHGHVLRAMLYTSPFDRTPNFWADEFMCSRDDFSNVPSGKVAILNDINQFACHCSDIDFVRSDDGVCWDFDVNDTRVVQGKQREVQAHLIRYYSVAVAISRAAGTLAI